MHAVLIAILGYFKSFDIDCIAKAVENVYDVFEKVHIYSGPSLNKQLTFGPPAVKSLRTEYGSLQCTIEIVKGLPEAIEHIHRFGSSHTDSIITENR